MANGARLLSAVLVVGLIGAVAAVVVVSPRRPSGVTIDKSTTASAAGEDAATREAFRVNQGLASDPALAAEFDDINARYFDGRVGAVTVRWESRLTGMGGAIASDFRLEGLTDGRTILLNPEIRGDDSLRRRTLTHEMVHVLLWKQHAGHGPAFQKALGEVATRASYMGLIASDEEKETWRAQLQAQAEALDREEQALREERSALEASNPAAPGLQQRIDAFNQRVERQHAAIGKYNGMVGVYNLMIAYPDGLDRERLANR